MTKILGIFCILGLAVVANNSTAIEPVQLPEVEPLHDYTDCHRFDVGCRVAVVHEDHHERIEALEADEHTIDTDTQLSDEYVLELVGPHTVDTDTQLSDGDIGAMGYIKVDTDTVYDDTALAAEVATKQDILTAEELAAFLADSDTVYDDTGVNVRIDGKQDELTGEQIAVFTQDNDTIYNDAAINARVDGERVNANRVESESVARDNALSGRINTNSANIESLGAENSAQWSAITDARDHADAGVSAAMAISMIQTAPSGRWGVSGGVGYYGGQSSAAVGLSGSSNTLSWKAGVTHSTDETGAAAGVSRWF